MSSPKIEVVTPNNTRLGEGPHWDEEKNILYYTDILEKAIYRFDPATNRQTSITLDGTVSFIIPVKGSEDQFVVSVGRSLALLTWDGESDEPQGLQVLTTVDNEEGNEKNQVNDGKADSSGRIWTGTMRFETGLKVTPNKASFYSCTHGKEAKKHLSDITCSNGLAWSKDGKTLFYNDTFTFKVEAFDFDVDTGTIDNRRTAFDFRANGVEGFPDGMTIDTNDNLWVASALDSEVIQVNPFEGKLLRRIRFPSPLITSVVFGGENLDELYVTSGAYNMTEEEKEKYPTAGRVYRVTGVGAKGFPMFRAVV